MEILLFFTVVVLVGGLVGGGFLIRDFGQQVLSRDARATVEAIQVRTEAETDRIRQELRGLVAEYQTQLGRLRARDVELLALVEGERERSEAEDATRQDAANALAEVERLRDEVKHLVPGGPTENSRQVARETALVEIDRQAAQIETSIIALTNPILLPGEPFAVPEDLAPDALRWENWKEVGESAFALGELFTLRRIHLSPETAASVTRCVTLLRTTLTRAIYPNLDPLPSVVQRQSLMDGLTTIGDALASMRRELATEYHGRDSVTPSPDRSPVGSPEKATSPLPGSTVAGGQRDPATRPASATAAARPSPEIAEAKTTGTAGAPRSPGTPVPTGATRTPASDAPAAAPLRPTPGPETPAVPAERAARPPQPRTGLNPTEPVGPSQKPPVAGR